MQVLYERCAGVDVGKDVIAVAVRLPGDGPDGRQTGRRTFKTFYGVLAEAARWLTSLGVTQVAMEATGIYSMPVYHALIEHGSFEKVLVCNAGTGLERPLAETPPDELNRILDVNVTGCLRYARACLPHLERRRGSMIHIASDAGVIGEDPIGAYSVSKAAVIMLGKMLAVDCGRRGVRSNVICPGDIVPGMREMLAPGEERRGDDVSGWPMPPIGRIGEAADVAAAAVFLASGDAAFVNGAVLLVDGGMRAAMRAGSPEP